MKVAIAQINTTQGDVRGNTERILRAAASARSGGARLVVFPELAIPGYCPRDLLYSTRFVAACEAALAEIATSAPPDLGLLVGTVSRNPTGRGRRLCNSAVLLSGGRILAWRHKTLLPTYDVFDEARYFEPAPEDQEPVEFLGHRIGVTICEDVWGETPSLESPTWDADPPAALAEAGSDILINLSASPFSEGRPAARERLVTRLASRLRRPVILVNLVGGNDEVVFDGTSVAAGAAGTVIARAAAFREETLILDLPDGGGGGGEIPPRSDDAGARLADLRDALVLGLSDYARKCGFGEAVIGLSGGIDSAVTAVLAARALGPGQVLGVALPSRYSAPESLEDARLLASRLGMPFETISIEPAFRALLGSLEAPFSGRPADVTEENLQARIRGVILMALSNKFRRLLLTTGNKSEMACGYATLYGDMCGGLAVISDVLKTTVYDLARLLNRDADPIPERTLTRAPTAELRPGQKDSDSLPSYEILDPILRLHIEDGLSASEIVGRGYDPGLVGRIVRMVVRAEYKRKQAPPGLRVTPKAFGSGRRMPIAGDAAAFFDEASGAACGAPPPPGGSAGKGRGSSPDPLNSGGPGASPFPAGTPEP